MTQLYFDKSIRENCDFALIPLKNISHIEMPDKDQLGPARIYLRAIEGMTLLNSKKFVVDSKAIADAIKEGEE